jgi:hypothetical protein
VFGVNRARGIWHTWQTRPNDGWVGGWFQLYSDEDELRMLNVASNADGRLEVFGVNATDRICTAGGEPRMKVALEVKAARPLGRLWKASGGYAGSDRDRDLRALCWNSLVGGAARRSAKT